MALQSPAGRQQVPATGGSSDAERGLLRASRFSFALQQQFQDNRKKLSPCPVTQEYMSVFLSFYNLIHFGMLFTFPYLVFFTSSEKYLKYFLEIVPCQHMYKCLFLFYCFIYSTTRMH